MADRRGPLRLPGFRWWRERGGRILGIALPFDDIMEFALALLSISPDELEKLGWTFADRKRLLDHFLASGRAAQGVPNSALPTKLITLRLPRSDVVRLRAFARRELPKQASDALILDRVLTILDAALAR